MDLHGVPFDENHPEWPFRDRKGQPIPKDEVGRSWDISKRRVGEETIAGIRVSTIHLVVGHPCWNQDAENCKGDGGCGLAIYETMCFTDDESDEWDQRQWRYHHLKTAIAGHARVVAMVKAATAAL